MNDKEKQAFAKRLNQALDAAGISGRGVQPKLAKMCGVSISGARKWLGGEAFPAREKWKQISNALGVDEEWLFLGRKNRQTEAIGNAIKEWRKDSEPGGITLAHLAKRSDIPLLRLSAIENGIAMPNQDEIEKLEVATNLDLLDEVVDMLTKSPPAELEKRFRLEETLSKINNDGCLVPLYQDIESAAGDGSITPDVEVPSEFAWVSYEWIKRTSKSDPNTLAIIRVRGDSMEPTIKSGDWVLIDTHIQNCAPPCDGIYVFRYDNTLFIKRLQILPGNKICAISDNTVYQPFGIENEDFQIIGRVCYVWRGESL